MPIGTTADWCRGRSRAPCWRDPEEAARQALSLARGAVATADGSILTLWVDTLCIHGDSPDAVAIATAVRRVLTDAQHRRGCSRIRVNRSVPQGTVRPLGDRAFLIGVADPEDGRALAGVLAETEGWPGSSLDVVCGFATVMVAVRDPDLDVAAVEEIVQRRAADRPPVGAARPAGARSWCPAPSTAPISTTWRRWPVSNETTWSACSVRPGSPSRSWDSRQGSPTSTGSPTSCGPFRDGPGRARPCRPVRWPWPTDTPRSTRRPRPAAGSWSAAPRFPSSRRRLRPTPRSTPGDVVRFTVAGPGEPVEPATPAPLAWPAAEQARPVLEVVAPGLRAVLQDDGRHGVASIGVPNAGPADPDSFVLANRLAGNRDGAGALEITAGGTPPALPRPRATWPWSVARPTSVSTVRRCRAGQVVPLAPGQLLEIGRLRGGLRTYLGVAGGLCGPEVLASVASDELSGLGPGPLRARPGPRCRTVGPAAR